MFLSVKRRAKLFKCFKCVKLSYLPYSLGIETGNICNLQCPLCPTGMKDASMEKGFMALSDFKDAINQLKGSLRSINLYSWGEPLLNPEIIEIIIAAKELNKNIRVVTSTNLNIENDGLFERLIRSGIDEVIISCDGVSQETYEKYRVGGSFDLVLNNIKKLVKFKIVHNSRVNLIWNFLVFSHNEHQIAQAKKMAQDLDVSLRIGKMRTNMKEEILRPHEESIREYKSWIPENKEYSAYDKERLLTARIIKTCRKPWQEVSINWNGDVFPCCAVYGDKFAYGNFKNPGIRQVWNNEKYVQARREILNRRLGAETICGICRNNGFMHM